MLLCEAISKAEKWRKIIEDYETQQVILTDMEELKQFLDLSLWALKKAREEDD